MGIANKGPMIWTSWKSTGLGKKIFGRDYERFINTVFGAIALVAGFFILLKSK